LTQPMRALALLAALPLAACASPAGSPAPAATPAPRTQAAPVSAPAAPRVEVDAAGYDLFRAARVDGAFVLLDTARNVLSVVNPAETERRHLPASTFKIPNTLIGLETGVIPDGTFRLPWDGKRRWLEAWNRDHDLPSAMKHSVVWYYQEVARRVGAARMRALVTAFAYGNRDTGRDDAIDRFWLDGPIAISPREQVDFLERMRAGKLPVKPAHVALVRRLITLDERPGLVLQGKTGLGFEGDRLVGWLVGFVEKDRRSYVYATLVLAPRTETNRVMPLRRALTEKLLARAGLR
jgi:beta-lactamase class D